MVKEIVNRIIVSFEDTLTIYEDNPVEIKIKLLDSKLRKIIEENPDIDLFDYFCEFYNKENNLKEIESFSKFRNKNVPRSSSSTTSGTRRRSSWRK